MVIVNELGYKVGLEMALETV